MHDVLFLKQNNQLKIKCGNFAKLNYIHLIIHIFFSGKHQLLFLIHYYNLIANLYTIFFLNKILGLIMPQNVN